MEKSHNRRLFLLFSKWERCCSSGDKYTIMDWRRRSPLRLRALPVGLVAIVVENGRPSGYSFIKNKTGEHRWLVPETASSTPGRRRCRNVDGPGVGAGQGRRWVRERLDGMTGRTAENGDGADIHRSVGAGPKGRKSGVRLLSQKWPISAAAPRRRRSAARENPWTGAGSCSVEAGSCRGSSSAGAEGRPRWSADPRRCLPRG